MREQISASENCHQDHTGKKVRLKMGLARNQCAIIPNYDDQSLLGGFFFGKDILT